MAESGKSAKNTHIADNILNLSFFDYVQVEFKTGEKIDRPVRIIVQQFHAESTKGSLQFLF